MKYPVFILAVVVALSCPDHAPAAEKPNVLLFDAAGQELCSAFYLTIGESR